MNILNSLGYTVTHVTEEVKALAAKAAGYTTALEKAFNSGLAVDIAALVPEGEVDREAIIAILETAYKSLQAIAAFDPSGVAARLQRAGSDITQLLHANPKHTISFYITAFEVVFNDMFGAAQTA